MFGPWMEAFEWLKASLPTSLKFSRPHFNFIAIHYLYMIGMSIFGSILLYPPGGLKYIDALFFASGAATQSGLNTWDTPRLCFRARQLPLTSVLLQVVLMLIACVCNPIFINTFVVFIRLYWFEKRFQHIVKEARSIRESRSRNRSEARSDLDLNRVEKGVGGRDITVLHHTTVPNGMSNTTTEKQGVKQQMESASGTSSEHSVRESRDSIEPGSPKDTSLTFLGKPPGFQRDITFEDEARPPHRQRREPGLDRVPEQLSAEQNIAFFERQRNAKDKGTLRIPGPRDFDRGDVPRALDEEEDGDELARTDTNVPQSAVRAAMVNRSSDDAENELNGDDHPVKRGITIDEPSRPRDRSEVDSGISKLKFPRFGRAKATPQDNATSGLRQRGRTRSIISIVTSRSQEIDEMPYLSWQPTIGRNSAFRALKTLALVLVLYFIGFHLFGVILLLPWFVTSSTWGPLAEADGFSRVWWGFFTPASMFNDLGYTLTPDSMVSFQLAVLPLLVGSFLIIIGNTGFPCMLRFVIWMASKFAPVGSGVWEELRFLLDHPRRCFTLLFPGKATWWLFWILFLLNGIDLLFFVVLDLHDPIITSLPPGYRVLDGLFQAASTRTAGFAVVNLAALHPAIQVSYLVMMYISVFPIAISVRRTNVYEEKSLGLYDGEGDEGEDKSYLAAHLRRQLSFDLWYIFLGLFVIAIVEGPRLQDPNEYAFTLFNVLFEIVSAYGTVGLSLGYPNINASFSAEFATLSKLVIIAMQIRGRHRGLPYALDRAILLPSESLHKEEDEEARRRTDRRASMMTEYGGGGGGGGGLDAQGVRMIRSRSQRRMSSGSEVGGLGRMLTGALNAGPMTRKFD
ncbi:cation transport protein-domain-containing protein [Cryomyces antarcticus]